MSKTILITGSSDGIGLATAKSFLELGHTVLLHGRSAEKLAALKKQLKPYAKDKEIICYTADLSVLAEVKALAQAVLAEHERLDVLINNAGVFKVPKTESVEGLDIRFVVNTIAPYLLSKELLPLLGQTGRIVNVSSAAQAPLKASDLVGISAQTDSAVYAQSKLALTMWSHQLGLDMVGRGPVVVAVNPASFLGSKMVKEAYGVAGGDVQKGADILVRAALSDEFKNAFGRYYDNDRGAFADPHADALSPHKTAELIRQLDELARTV
jgi:NAD(P)-dependent dehydrogenase (short-subunit alcohol dehydrogenase family)